MVGTRLSGVHTLKVANSMFNGAEISTPSQSHTLKMEDSMFKGAEITMSDERPSHSPGEVPHQTPQTGHIDANQARGKADISKRPVSLSNAMIPGP